MRSGVLFHNGGDVAIILEIALKKVKKEKKSLNPCKELTT